MRTTLFAIALVLAGMSAATATDTTYSFAMVLGAYHRFSPRLAADFSLHMVFGAAPDDLVILARGPDSFMSIQKDAYNPMSLELHVRFGL